MKKYAFIGQAMPKPPYPEKPFGRTKLYSWFSLARIPDEYVNKNFYFSALVSYFPGAKKGSHIVPSKLEVLKERPLLKKFLLDTNPDIIVPVGSLSILECLQREKILLEEIIGNEFFVDPYGLMKNKRKVIPLPHPSGASTWVFNKNNEVLLRKALKLLKSEVNNI